MSSAIPFRVHVGDDVLDDLVDRIGRTRWPDQVPGIGWAQGTELGYLRELLAHWASDFDWRKAEADINRHDQFLLDIDDVTIHFVHARAKHGDGIPIVLTHGWPSTFLEYLPVVDLLTDPSAHGLDGPAFDVVIPSLPGYGFSRRPDRTGLDYRVVARLWHRLMQSLGYRRYAAGGGDFGSGIATYMALDDPQPLLGIYLSHLEIQPYSGPGSRPLSDAERHYRAQNDAWWDVEGGYMQIQSTKPQTVGYGLNDSPVGLAAWIVEKWRTWADTGGDIDRRFSKDLLLTMLTVYWATQTATSSLRHYYDDRPWFVQDPSRLPGPRQRVTVPVAFSTWPAYADTEGVPPREWVERSYDVVQWTAMPTGGHFAAVEEPLLFAGDVIAAAASWSAARGVER